LSRKKEGRGIEAYFRHIEILLMPYQCEREPLSDDEVNRLTKSSETFQESLILPFLIPPWVVRGSWRIPSGTGSHDCRTDPAKPLISRIMPLADGQQVFDALHRAEPGLMKIVLHP